MSPGSKCSSILPMTLARTVPSGCLWTSVLAAMRLGSPVEVHVEGAAAGERRAVGAGHVHHRGHFGEAVGNGVYHQLVGGAVGQHQAQTGAADALVGPHLGII